MGRALLGVPRIAILSESHGETGFTDIALTGQHDLGRYALNGLNHPLGARQNGVDVEIPNSYDTVLSTERGEHRARGMKCEVWRMVRGAGLVDQAHLSPSIGAPETDGRI